MVDGHRGVRHDHNQLKTYNPNSIPNPINRCMELDMFVSYTLCVNHSVSGKLYGTNLTIQGWDWVVEK